MIDDYIKLARDGRIHEDWNIAEKYYDLVQREDPDNIEAGFYSIYGKVQRILSYDNVYKRQIIINVFASYINLIPDKYNVEDKVNNKTLIYLISRDIIRLMKIPGYNRTEKKLIDKAELKGLLSKVYESYINALKKIVEMDNRLFIHEAIVRISKEAYGIGVINKEAMEEILANAYILNDDLKDKMIHEYWQKNPLAKIEYTDKMNLLKKEVYKQDSIIAKLPENNRIDQLKNLLDQLKLKKASAPKSQQLDIDKQIESIDENLKEAYYLREKAMMPYQEKIDQTLKEMEQIDMDLIDYILSQN